MERAGESTGRDASKEHGDEKEGCNVGGTESRRHDCDHALGARSSRGCSHASSAGGGDDYSGNAVACREAEPGEESIAVWEIKPLQTVGTAVVSMVGAAVATHHKVPKNLRSPQADETGESLAHRPSGRQKVTTETSPQPSIEHFAAKPRLPVKALSDQHSVISKTQS